MFPLKLVQKYSQGEEKIIVDIYIIHFSSSVLIYCPPFEQESKLRHYFLQLKSVWWILMDYKIKKHVHRNYSIKSSSTTLKKCYCNTNQNKTIQCKCWVMVQALYCLLVSFSIYRLYHCQIRVWFSVVLFVLLLFLISEIFSNSLIQVLLRFVSRTVKHQSYTEKGWIPSSCFFLVVASGEEN